MDKKEARKLAKGLTPKQKKFCNLYVIDWNATKAAKLAGYSKRSASALANETLNKPYIQEYIAAIKDDFEKLCGITKARQLNELSKIAYSSIAHLHDSWVDLKDYESLNQDQKDAIESIEYDAVKDPLMGTEAIKVKIKLFSKQAAIDSINKMMGYNATEKLSIEATKEIKGITFKK